MTNQDYFMFGSFYGMCFGEDCIEIFKLENAKLYEDTLDKYPNTEFYAGEYVQLSQEKYDIAMSIINDFPMELLEEPHMVIGQPDAGDWGGLYIEYKIDGIHKMWLLDRMLINVPVQYHDFINKVKEKVELLN